jgi:diacylglycerol kinase family enzyme
MKKAALIFNPCAGSSRAERTAQVQSAAAVLRAAGIEAAIMPTRAAGSASDQAIEAIAEGCDTVIACGGDGTIHECMQRIVAEGAPASLGILPLGTGNALAKDLRIPRDPVRAAQMLLECVPERIAVGRMEPLKNSSAGRYFIVTAGIGADAHMLYRLNFEIKRRHGMLAYYFAAMRIVLRHTFPPFEIEFTEPVRANGARSGGARLPAVPLGNPGISASAAEGRARTAIVSQALGVRISDFGGLIRKLAPGASLRRRDLRLVLFRTPRRSSFLLYVLWRFLGAPWLAPNVELADACEATCRPLAPSAHLPRAWKEAQRNARIHAEVDGELLSELPVRIFSVPDALTLLVPKHFLL